MKNTFIKYQRIINKIAFISTILCSQTIYAQTDSKPQLFEGVIGSAPIVIEFTMDPDNTVSGRYFYRKQSLDIAIDGMKLADGSVLLGENQNYGDDKQVDMVLHPDHGGFQGEWNGHDAKHPKHIAIKLTPVAANAQPNVYQLPADSTEYDQIRLSSLSLRPQKLTHFGHYDLQWWLEPISKIRFFRVVSGYPTETLLRINTELTIRQWQEVNSYFSCLFNGAQNHGGDYEDTVTPHFMNEKILSSSVESSYYCGGAHPDFGDNPINIDVKTGKELQLEDVLWLGKNSPSMTFKRDTHGDRSDYDYETKVLGPWVNQTMINLHPNDVGSDSKNEDDCNYRDPEVWQFPTYYFTPKGLHLAASFARVERACDNPDWAIVPWKIVNQHQGVLGMVLP